jgi:D-sedoheptulose 7-phosphate isomerase
VGFTEEYLKEVISIASNLDKSKIDAMAKKLCEIRQNNGRLFVLGVGGSAANSSHAVNDFRKLVGIEAYAPTDNISELTARTNDEGWDTVFEEYLKCSKLNTKDMLLILSVGGGDRERKVSNNLCNAIDYANSLKAKTISIVGRSQGYAVLNTDICLVIPVENPENVTPHSEAFQAVVWHLLVSHPLLKRNSTKW